MKQFTVTYLHNGELKKDIIFSCSNARLAWVEGRRRVNELDGKAVLKDCKIVRPLPEPIAFEEPNRAELPRALQLRTEDFLAPEDDSQDPNEVAELLEQANKVLKEDAETANMPAIVRQALHSLGYLEEDPDDEEEEDDDYTDEAPEELQFTI